MSVVVQLVVGELELVEGDDLLHPVGAAGGGVGVHVDPAGTREGERSGYVRVGITSEPLLLTSAASLGPPFRPRPSWRCGRRSGTACRPPG